MTCKYERTHHHRKEERDQLKAEIQEMEARLYAGDDQISDMNRWSWEHLLDHRDALKIYLLECDESSDAEIYNE